MSLIKSTTIAFVFLFLFFGSSRSQHQEIDSLFTLLKQSQEDTTKVIILNRLAFRYYQTVPDTALLYARKAMSLAEKLDYQRGIGSSHNSLGFIAYSHSDYPRAETAPRTPAELGEGTGRRPACRRPRGHRHRQDANG